MPDLRPRTLVAAALTLACVATAATAQPAAAAKDFKTLMTYKRIKVQVCKTDVLRFRIDTRRSKQVAQIKYKSQDGELGAGGSGSFAVPAGKRTVPEGGAPLAPAGVLTVNLKPGVKKSKTKKVPVGFVPPC